MQALLIDIEGWEIQMERLLKQIEAYKPCNEQEEKDPGIVDSMDQKWKGYCDQSQ